MNTIKTSISIPNQVFQEAKDLSDNFSSLVTEALEEYIRKKKIDRAISSFGKLEERRKSSTAIVDGIRTDEGRDYTDRTD
ncbi:MAG: type II toxin-antitoxin system CcdA family antitoxin [Deltaproteobacteria bacterium]|nr:type II toxin-antitoxin system CcdA family antitoxin [Deltaproteobacteria bacterium]